MTAREIIKRVADQHMLPVDAIVGPGKQPHIVRARWDAVVAVRKAFPDRSLPWVGQRFNRHHATILHVLYAMGVKPTNKARYRRAEAA